MTCFSRVIASGLLDLSLLDRNIHLMSELGQSGPQYSWPTISAIWWLGEGSVPQTSQLYSLGIQPLQHGSGGKERKMLATQTSQRDPIALDGNFGEREPHLLGHTQNRAFCHTERVGWEGVGHGSSTIDSHYSSEIQQIFLSKCFVICYMPLGQFPQTLNG